MAVLLAIGVAFLVAISSLLQHRATQAVRTADATGFRLFRQLLRSQPWLTAKSLDVLALALPDAVAAKRSLMNETSTAGNRCRSRVLRLDGQKHASCTNRKQPFRHQCL